MLSEQAPAEHRGPIFLIWLMAMLLNLTETVPQIVRVQRQKNAATLSVDFVAMGLLANVLWTIYALFTYDPLGVIAALISTTLYLILLGQTLYYQ